MNLAAHTVEFPEWVRKGQWQVTTRAGEQTVGSPAGGQRWEHRPGACGPEQVHPVTQDCRLTGGVLPL